MLLPKGMNSSLTVYFTVLVSSECAYTLEVELTNVFDVETGYKYSVNLKDAESGLLRLSGNAFEYAVNKTEPNSETGEFEQVVMLCEY